MQKSIWFLHLFLCDKRHSFALSLILLNSRRIDEHTLPVHMAICWKLYFKLKFSKKTERILIMKNKEISKSTLAVRLFFAFMILFVVLCTKYVKNPQFESLRKAVYYCIKSDFDIEKTINSIKI